MIKRILLILLLISMVVVSGCINIPEKNIMGIVENPELPTIPKPDDILYCEKDEDCTTTIHLVDSCCTIGCGGAINTEGKLYLEEWYKLNCQDPSTYRDCLVAECCVIKGVKCENNKCTGIFNC